MALEPVVQPFGHLTLVLRFAMANSQRNGRDAVGGHNSVRCCRSSSGEGRRCSTCSDMTDLRQDGLTVCRFIYPYVTLAAVVSTRFLFTTPRNRSTVRHVRSDGSLSVERLARSALRLLHVLKPLTCGGCHCEAVLELPCMACCEILRRVDAIDESIDGNTITSGLANERKNNCRSPFFVLAV